MIQKILVTLDGSKESETVIPYIENLAAKLQMEVIIVNIVEPAYHVYAMGMGPVQVPYSESEMEPFKVSAKEYLKKVVEKLQGKGISASYEVRLGSAAEEIIRLADSLHVDMVAMSTHGRSGVGRWAFGSVAEKVLRGGNTPVLLVRTPKPVSK
jgi:nucleotide-binding universal stress UspA family protein